MTMNTEQERAEFEAWLRVKPCGAAHDFAWEAWQARAALQSQDREEDPLQAAADWLFKAIDGCMVFDIQRHLRIGHNRAMRLFGHARRIEGDGD